jgi:hypothetical protein
LEKYFESSAESLFGPELVFEYPDIEVCQRFIQLYYKNLKGTNHTEKAEGGK